MQAYECVCPAGLAAGFDKDAEAVKGLLGLGLGFMEVGEWQQQQQQQHSYRHAVLAAGGMLLVSGSVRSTHLSAAAAVAHACLSAGIHMATLH
jgi:dihydroorotate dehydrogenase